MFLERYLWLVGKQPGDLDRNKLFTLVEADQHSFGLVSRHDTIHPNLSLGFDFVLYDVQIVTSIRHLVNLVEYKSTDGGKLNLGAIFCLVPQLH